MPHLHIKSSEQSYDPNATYIASGFADEFRRTILDQEGPARKGFTDLQMIYSARARINVNHRAAFDIADRALGEEHHVPTAEDSTVINITAKALEAIQLFRVQESVAAESTNPQLAKDLMAQAEQIGLELGRLYDASIITIGGTRWSDIPSSSGLSFGFSSYQTRAGCQMICFDRCTISEIKRILLEAGVMKPLFRVDGIAGRVDWELVAASQLWQRKHRTMPEKELFLNIKVYMAMHRVSNRTASKTLEETKREVKAELRNSTHDTIVKLIRMLGREAVIKNGITNVESLVDHIERGLPEYIPNVRSHYPMRIVIKQIFSGYEDSTEIGALGYIVLGVGLAVLLVLLIRACVM